MKIKNGNFNGNSNFNNSKSGERVKIGAESCLLLAIAIVLDIVIEKFALRFYRTEQPWGREGATGHSAARADLTINNFYRSAAFLNIIVLYLDNKINLY
ncbi:hypothetical protein CRP01_17240 [Flavilitoribacter nigricans DSM 23189 = NBRC 102662]|uniref:Uncharacterized protein n=1 Tax=Flavilitoribacter nigricans (strain ATCC 23147 / DSM 23189 / NBRC 102662 / NCIMB 1420 / SS-2) TaxID=1122177 RepID=A0A2D0N9R8_FLAN2|nr:hypothetical protein CRP01_17240 [Flavilitoribacter nigricans DSM 23189 = NBRC 102662]